MRQVLFGILWTIVFYFFACVVVGAVAGGIAGSHDPQHASEAGARAGAEAVGTIRLYLFLGAIGVSAIGASLRILPGTRGGPAGEE